VHFAVVQAIPARPDRVLAAYLDPAFYAHLRSLPDVDPPEVVEQTRTDTEARLRVRYRFRGSLSHAVARVVDPERLVWVQESLYDLRSGSATFDILPEHYASRLRCHGLIRLLDDGGGGTRRDVEGELQVRFPLVGGAVGRAIVSGLRAHLAREVDLLRGWLAAGNPTG
jgi:hypothetical protein